MQINGAAYRLKPAYDKYCTPPSWCVTGFGKFIFSSKKDAQTAIDLANAVAEGERNNIRTSIRSLIG